MSQFYDSASLVLVPSGYKSGKIYSQKPLSTDGELSFSRACTATRVNASGLIESVASGVPRLDYSGGCPSLLLEPQRTNLVQFSEQFDNAAWEVGSVASVSANTSETLDPSGYYGADKLTANGSGQLYIRKNVYLGTAQTCTNSIFVKKANHRYVGLRNSGTTSQHDVFDFDTKTWTNNSGATLSYDELGNGWFRLKSTNTDAVNLNYYWSVIPAVDTTGSENATASNLSVYIWGGQAEQNAAYATSYIPTLSSAVTRVRDEFSDKNIDFAFTDNSKGTFFFEVDLGGLPPSANAQFRFGNSSTPLQIALFFSDNGLGIYSYNGGAYIINVNPTESQKIAVTFNGNTAIGYSQGVKRSTVVPTNPYSIDRISSMSPASGSFIFKQILFFDSVLTDAQCIELTTL